MNVSKHSIKKIFVHPKMELALLQTIESQYSLKPEKDLEKRVRNIEELFELQPAATLRERLWNIKMKLEMNESWIDETILLSEHGNKTVNASLVETFSEGLDLKVRILHNLTQGHHVILNPPVYIKDSEHYGEHTGKGLFALAPFLSGQLITQFTGSISLRQKKSHTGKRSRSYEARSKERQDYVYKTNYKGVEYIVNPLDAQDNTTVDHFCAFMNEPSPPPYKVGDEIIYVFPGTMDAYDLSEDLVSENVKRIEYAKVTHYDHETGKYTIQSNEIDPTQVVETFPEFIRYKDKKEPSKHFYRSNCVWFDLNVPLEMYEFVDASKERIRTLKVKEEDECQVTFVKDSFTASSSTLHVKDEVSACFEYFTDADVTCERYTPGQFKNLKKGTILILKDTIFEGMKRKCLIIEKQKKCIVVKMTCEESEKWRLPKQIKAGKYFLKYIPFPLVYCCKNIEIDDELLVMYTPQSIETRGLQCMKIQSRDKYLRNEWNAISRYVASSESINS